MIVENQMIKRTNRKNTTGKLVLLTRRSNDTDLHIKGDDWRQLENIYSSDLLTYRPLTCIDYMIQK